MECDTLEVDGSGDMKIRMHGSSNPYIRFDEGTTYRGYIQYHSTNNALLLGNQETSSHVNITGNLSFTTGGSTYSVWHAGNDGSGSGLDADLLDGVQGSSYLRSDAADTASGDITFSGGAGAATIAAGSDLRFGTGTWTGEASAKIQYHSTALYIQYPSYIRLRNSSGSDKFVMDSSGNITNINGITAGATIQTNNTSAQIQSGGWFYNTNSNYGLHNVANNTHFYCDSATSWILRSASTQSSNAIKFQTGTTNRGYVYATNSNEIGFLNYAGSWSVRVMSDKKVNFYNDITTTHNVTAYSDITLKDDIETIPDALEKVSQIRGVTYNRNDLEDAPRQTGVIAQEVEKVLPEVVSENEDGLKTVAYGNIVGLLIQAVKELKAEVNELKLTRTFPMMVRPEVK